MKIPKEGQLYEVIENILSIHIWTFPLENQTVESTAIENLFEVKYLKTLVMIIFECYSEIRVCATISIAVLIIIV